MTSKASCQKNQEQDAGDYEKFLHSNQDSPAATKRHKIIYQMNMGPIQLLSILLLSLFICVDAPSSEAEIDYSEIVRVGPVVIRTIPLGSI